MSFEMPELAGVEHRYVDAGGLRMHVAEAGSGPPLVLLHGWPQHWYAWHKMIGPLSERYRVICPDLRGFGWSDAPHDGYEKEQLASDVLAALDALGVAEPVRIAGHDWGGFVAFLCCLRQAERFERLMALNIIHPWIRRPDDRRERLKTLRRTSYQFPLITPGLGTLTIRRPAFVKKALHSSSFDASVWTEQELSIFAGQWRRPGRARATVALYRAFLLREVGPLISGHYHDQRLTVPTRLITGVADPVIRARQMGGYEDHADDMAVEELEACGHWSPVEVPDELVRRMTEFFA
jgi:pimeloyl-ACP methyl ester carboxylesterase